LNTHRISLRRTDGSHFFFSLLRLFGAPRICWTRAEATIGARSADRRSRTLASPVVDRNASVASTWDLAIPIGLLSFSLSLFPTSARSRISRDVVQNGSVINNKIHRSVEEQRRRRSKDEMPSSPSLITLISPAYSTLAWKSLFYPVTGLRCRCRSYLQNGYFVMLFVAPQTFENVSEIARWCFQSAIDQMGRKFVTCSNDSKKTRAVLS